MNRMKQKAALLRAATWVAKHPGAWNKKRFFGTNTGRTTSTGGEVRGFDVMGATFPYKHDAFKASVAAQGNKMVAEWVFKNFPKKVIRDIEELNDISSSPQEAANRVRGYVGAHYTSKT